MSVKSTLQKKRKSGEIRSKSSKSALNSGKFSSGKKFENQEIPGQIRRFGKPVCIPLIQQQLG
jgi:hypothetical protein